MHDKDCPTNDLFTYNRLYPPLFFSKPTESESQYWISSMSNITREYFRMSHQYNISSQTPLSNGITAGEYAMWVLIMNHQKRNSSD